jgi:hypothetical protein
MNERGVCVEMRREDFEGGMWSPYILDAYSQSSIEKFVPTDEAGPEIVREIEKFLQSGLPSQS